MNEEDGYDETLVPVDYSSSGQIRDDDLYDYLVCAMPAGATLVSLMDCCHSGTVLDLPYKYQAKTSNPFKNMHCRALPFCFICIALFVIVCLAFILAA